MLDSIDSWNPWFALGDFLVEKKFDRLFRVWRKIDNLMYEIGYRTVDRYHVIKTDLEPGYRDPGYMVLPALEAIFMRYVEEHDSMHIDGFIGYVKDHLDDLEKVEQWERDGSPDDDRKYDLLPRAQIEDAITLLHIYQDLKFRKYRPDPWDLLKDFALETKTHEVPGMPEYCVLEIIAPEGYDEARKKMEVLEAQYEKEDEDLMIRIIKIRDNLWT